MIARSDQWHDLKTLGSMAEEWLPEVAFEVSEDSALLSKLDVSRHHLCLLCATMTGLPEAEEAALVRYVNGGGGLLGLHSCTVVEEERREYVELIGGRFAHHSPYHEFAVCVTEVTHPVAVGVADFALQDELYVLDREPAGATVLATAEWEERAQPMVYAKSSGKGRVCYNALGHDAAAFNHPAFRQLVVQGARWAAGLT
jgi:type 1 glutamine amidotransferase